MGATKVLLAMGAEVNAGDADGMTPLMWASRRGHAEIVRILLEAKALPDVLDNEGLSARIHAELLKPTRTSAGVLSWEAPEGSGRPWEGSGRPIGAPRSLPGTTHFQPDSVHLNLGGLGEALGGLWEALGSSREAI